jgi:hypothetical protein
MQMHVYSAVFSAVSVSALQDLFQLAPATNPCILMAVRIGQSSEEGDAAAEMLQIQISRVTLAVNGSGGSVPVARAHSPGSPAATTIVEANNTTQATVATIMVDDCFNVQAGWLWLPTPEEQILCVAGQGLVVELPVAPADAITMSGTITFAEPK